MGYIIVFIVPRLITLSLRMCGWFPELAVFSHFGGVSINELLSPWVIVFSAYVCVGGLQS